MKINFSIKNAPNNQESFIKEIVCNQFASIISNMPNKEFIKIFRVNTHELTEREYPNVKKYLVECEIDINEVKY